MTSPDALDDADLDAERAAHAARIAAGYREAARRALAFARRYRDEEGAPGGAREIACILQARAWRRAAHATHTARPGLARTRGDVGHADAPASKRTA